MTISEQSPDMSTAHKAVSDVVIVALQALVKTNVSLEHKLHRLSSRQGKLHLLFDRAQSDRADTSLTADFVQALLFDDDVVDFLTQLRAAGKQIVVVSDLPQQVVEGAAKRLGQGDEATSTADFNGPEQKVQHLIHRFGPGFTYIGATLADVAFWRASAGAVTVRATAKVQAAAQNLSNQVHHVSPKTGGHVPWRACLLALRPHQWLKNLLVYLPLLGAAETDLRLWATAIYAFIAFCLAASSVYVVNDLLDLAADRSHKRKRRRPFASGAVPLEAGLVMASGLLVAAFILASIATNWVFVLVLVGYFLASLVYSLALKRELVVDIITLAGLYSVRIIGGGVATQSDLSPWMLAFSGFFFLSLAAVKRQAELYDLASRGRLKAAGRAYRATDLPIVSMMAIAAGYTAVLILALFLSSGDVQAHYVSPKFLMLICPILLFWISRVIMLTHRGQMSDDPVVFAGRDRVSWLCMAGSLAVMLFARTL